MARRGTNKYYSIQHEEWVERTFNGRRSKSSGAADYDKGDVRTAHLLIECKMTQQVSRPLPKFVREFEKIAQESWENGKTPALALRFWAPQSPLARGDGWIDLTMMLATDAADREDLLNEHELQGSV